MKDRRLAAAIQEDLAEDTRSVINTFDQLKQAGGGVAILVHHGGIRTHYVAGWSIMRVVDGQFVNTDPSSKNPWYNYGQKVFLSHLPERDHALSLKAAQRWVAKTYGERGPWVRNALRDYVPQRIQRQFPIKRRYKRLYE